ARLLKNSVARRFTPSAAKAGTDRSGIYRSGKPLRYPKARTKPSFSANCQAHNPCSALREGREQRAVVKNLPDSSILQERRIHNLEGC
ncbi:MAG: hypothetical protein ACLPMG_13900, partial [Terriglobales bacterium]